MQCDGDALSKLLARVQAKIKWDALTDESARRLCDALTEALGASAPKVGTTEIRIENRSAVRFDSFEVLFQPVAFNGHYISLKMQGVEPRSEMLQEFERPQNFIKHDCTSDWCGCETEEFNIDVSVFALPHDPSKGVTSEFQNSVLEPTNGRSKGVQAPNLLIEIAHDEKMHLWVL